MMAGCMTEFAISDDDVREVKIRIRWTLSTMSDRNCVDIMTVIRSLRVNFFVNLGTRIKSSKD